MSSYKIEKKEKYKVKKIKSFIYLDDYKMYSISSQLFEGLTEYIVSSEDSRTSESTEQKGAFGGGRLMADIIETNNSKTEKKFLHDYSYTLFEDALFESNKVIEIDESNIEGAILQIDNFTFVRVSNRVVFNDTKYIQDSIENFNHFGEALTYVTNPDLVKQINETKESIKTVGDRNQRKQKENLVNKRFNIRQVAKESGLNMDDKYLEHLKYLINYGYNEQFEIQIPFHSSSDHYLFSGILKREKLIEDELSLIKKYSRQSEKQFTMFGMLTQTKKLKEDIPLYRSSEDEDYEPTLKEALMKVVTTLGNVEGTFTGKLEYEYIIDPIAVYREI